jgi:endonuclease/exonuclease/phosphatase (EEP) superfamily protein YafD
LKIPGRLQWFLGLGLVLLSITHWFRFGINLLELLSAFAHFTLGLASVFIVLSAVFRLPVLGISSLISAVICGVLVVPHFSSFEASEDADFTIAQFNLYHHNPTPEQAIKMLAAQNVDVFTIQELNPNCAPFIDSVFQESHPYSVEAPQEGCCYGIGLYSRYPIISYKVLDLENTPTIIAQIAVGNQELTVVSLHTRPPVFPNETMARNQQLTAVADIVSNETNSYLVIGDFNIVPWDNEFKTFLKQGKLSAVRNGFQATYPMDLGFPLIPIDHLTYSENLTPTSCESVTIPGSDHRGMIAGFKFKD